MSEKDNNRILDPEVIKDLRKNKNFQLGNLYGSWEICSENLEKLTQKFNKKENELKKANLEVGTLKGRLSPYIDKENNARTIKKRNNIIFIIVSIVVGLSLIFLPFFPPKENYTQAFKIFVLVAIAIGLILLTSLQEGKVDLKVTLITIVFVFFYSVGTITDKNGVPLLKSLLGIQDSKSTEITSENNVNKLPHSSINNSSNRDKTK